MANNPYVNKVQFGNTVVMDISGDTVAANKMLSGVTAHDKSGASITGSIPTKTASDLVQSTEVSTTVGRTFIRLTVPSGYYANACGVGTSEVYLPVPSSGTSVFTVNIPNGTTTPDESTSADWIKIDIEVDSNGNSNVTDDTIAATGVSF